MTPITAFKTTDGKIFESREEANQHQTSGILLARIAEFLKANETEHLTVDEIIFRWEKHKKLQFIYSNIADLELTARTLHCLQAENIQTVSDLLKYTPNMLLKTPNLGRKSLNEVIECLKLRGLSLVGAA